VKNLEGYTILWVLVAYSFKFQHLYHMLHHEYNPKLFSIPLSSIVHWSNYFLHVEMKVQAENML
jgi:hypothetical protein